MALDFKQIVETDSASPSAPGRIGEVIDEWLKTVITDSAVAGTAVEDTSEVFVAASIAESISALSLVLLLVALLAVLVLVTWLVYTVANLFRRVPWVGDKLANGMILAASLILNVRYGAIQQIASIVPTIWTKLEQIIGYFTDRHSQHTDAIKPTVHGVNAQAVNTALGRLQTEINALRSEIGAINAHTGHISGTPLPSDIATLPEQMQYLQAQIHTLYQNQLASYQTMSQLVTTVNELERAYRELYHATVGIRTVELGWQDIVTQIQDQERKVRDIDAKQSTELHHHASSIAELSPLALLLEPGIAGLRNLRKLEDDPCQCPKFGGIGGDMGTALATLLWVENG